MPSVSSNRKGDRLTNHVDRSIPRNSAALMRSIELVVGGQVIGYVQEIAPAEQRELTDIREIGNEDIVEIAPGGPKGLTMTVSRVLLYHSRMMQVFDDIPNGHGNAINGIRSLMDYNYPFDVIVLMRRNIEMSVEGSIRRLSGVGGDTLDLDSEVSLKGVSEGGGVASSNAQIVIVDHFHECWFQDVKYDVKAKEDFTIVESGTIRYTWRTGQPLYSYEGQTVSGASTFAAFGLTGIGI